MLAARRKESFFLRAKKKLFTTQISEFEFLGSDKRRKGRGRRSLVKNKYENRNNEIKHKILSKQKIRMTERNAFCVVSSMEGNERFQVYQQDSIEIFIVYWFSLTYRNCISLLKRLSTEKSSEKYFSVSHTAHIGKDRSAKRDHRRERGRDWSRKINACFPIFILSKRLREGEWKRKAF